MGRDLKDRWKIFVKSLFLNHLAAISFSPKNFCSKICQIENKCCGWDRMRIKNILVVSQCTTRKELAQKRTRRMSKQRPKMLKDRPFNIQTWIKSNYYYHWKLREEEGYVFIFDEGRLVMILWESRGGSFSHSRFVFYFIRPLWDLLGFMYTWAHAEDKCGISLADIVKTILQSNKGIIIALRLMMNWIKISSEQQILSFHSSHSFTARKSATWLWFINSIGKTNLPSGQYGAMVAHREMCTVSNKTYDNILLVA